MIPVLTAEDVRRQDADAVARGIPVARLMDNAGSAVARAARNVLGGTYGRRVVVLCGSGNNAGDGLVAAEALRRQGAHCTAILTTAGDALNDLARANLDQFGGRAARLDQLPRELARADMVIDAIFGVGLNRAPAGEQAEAIQECVAVRRARAGAMKVLAVDVPSGIDADTGRRLDHAIEADVTVTFGGTKPGLVFSPGVEHAGTVVIADIGTSIEHPTLQALEARDVAAMLPRRGRGTHKRSSGVVLVVAGSNAMPGAAALTTGAVVHAGAGLTVLCAPEDVCRVVVSRVPEITTIPVPTSAEGRLDVKALDVLRPRLDEFDAVAIGPGLSTHPAASELVRAVVAEARCPVVVDADGLNAFAGSTTALRNEHGVLCTPHAGELSRLIGLSAREIGEDRIAAAIRAAAELNAAVLLKGQGSVAAGNGIAWINTTGGPALAPGGTGDVLTGLVAALVGQTRAGHTGRERERAFDAGWGARLLAAAAWLHGAAADRIASRISPHPANASALIDELGPTMHAVTTSL